MGAYGVVGANGEMVGLGPMGGWWGWLWMALGLLLVVLFVVGIVLLIIWLFRQVAGKQSH